MAQFSFGSPGTRVVGRGPGPLSLFIMQPAWMQMELPVVSGSGDAPRDPPHWLVTEIGRLQCFDKEGGANPEFGKAVEQKSEALFLSAYRAQHDRLGDRS